MRPSRSLQGAAGTDGVAVVVILAVALLAAMALMLVRRVPMGWSSTAKWWHTASASLSAHKACAWDVRALGTADTSSSAVRVQLQPQAAVRPLTPVSRSSARSKEPSGKESQPTSGWIRSMQPAQGYELLDSRGLSPEPCSFSLADGPSDMQSPHGELQCVTPTALAPHPELPRIRVTIPSPMMRLYAQ